jgi:Uncharacterized conserved protein (DUF2249)/Hemerythrin HHE cation binding domain
MSKATSGGSAAQPAGGGPQALTLRAEHDLLLGEVTARAEDVLSEADAGRWPQQQLQGLLDYLHLEVLRHILDEEWLLFRMSHHTPEDLAPLRQDHLDLRGTIEELADMAGRGGDGSPTELSRTTRTSLVRLDNHTRAEQDLLTAHDEVPSTASLGSRPHAWYDRTEGPVINLAELPGPLGVDAVMSRLLRLRSGEQVELQANSDPAAVWHRLAMADPGGYGFSYLAQGPEQWRVQITRRPAS